jgi:hypothetical protein
MHWQVVDGSVQKMVASKWPWQEFKQARASYLQWKNDAERLLQNVPDKNSSKG